MRVVAPCNADRTLAHQVLRVHYAGASVAWRYTLDMSSLNASSLPTTRIAASMAKLREVGRDTHATARSAAARWLRVLVGCTAGFSDLTGT